MAKVDMDAMREELEALKAGRKTGPKVSRLKLREGLNRLRLLPPFVVGKPWRKYQVAFGVGPEKVTVVPRRQYGLEPDPFMDHIDSIASRNDKASQALLFGPTGINPKERFVMFVIDRDAEDAGPQAFETNGQVVQEIHKFFADPDYGDLTDPDEGRDINLTYIPKEKNKAKGFKFPAWEVVPRPASTPLSKDEDKANAWLAEDLFERFRIGYPSSEQFMEAALNGATKDFKGPWKTRVDGTPLFEEDEDGDGPAVTPAEQVKAAVPPALKGPSAADKIKQALSKK